jgi:hypothetical protein
MEIIIRGVRGSIANPAPDTAFYGGNTACVELHTDSGALLFFDAGTGLRGAGDNLPGNGECHIFQWPWPRYLPADLLDSLNWYGVAAVGLDIMFAEPDGIWTATSK